MDIKINVLEQGDLSELKELLAVFETEFEMKDFTPPADDHLQALLAKDSFYAITAKVGGKVIGGLTIYVLDQYYSTKPLAYIYDLAILKSYQRKGIGKKFMAFTTDFFRQKGFAEVFVQADRVDGYALNFYRLTNPTNEEDVVHFYYTL
ncbi:GNAT family N-acetyltransferase [Flavisolibacter sp. BT320]|nr:GNAT family N-acetyltransferase [Flavisolibacter longurius]